MKKYLLILCTISFLALGGWDGVAFWNQGSIAEAAAPGAQKAHPKGVWIRIVKDTFQLYLMDGAKTLHTYRIAVGKNTGNKQKTGDLRTPEGHFSVRQIQNATAWTHDFRDGKGVIAGAYGPWFIRLKTDPWNGIGIHGTHDPASIGTRASEGCIRMHNSDLDALKKTIKPGTPVVIEP